MKVLMFGWEFPPLLTGGLGTACFGITKGLVDHDVAVTFVMPYLPETVESHVRLVSATPPSVERAVRKVIKISSLLSPYITSSSYDEALSEFEQRGGIQARGLYGTNLYEEVERYARLAARIAAEEDHDIIHAHDWLTFKAALAARSVSGKPVVVHVHATEYDRTGGHCNSHVAAIEREGVHAADHVVTVSGYTKRILIEHYGVPAEKISVVHNAVEHTQREDSGQTHHPFTDKNVVLFLGRLTLQKGPEYFLHAAQRVARHDPRAVFVLAGDGDKVRESMELASHLGISERVFHTGFLKGPDVDRAYRMASVYVMPSVSEPFGITALEAMRNGVPTIISKQSGVSEVVRNALKMDFWDTERLANQILAINRYSVLKESLALGGIEEVQALTWTASAGKLKGIYEQTLQGVAR